jgi:ABC-type multidrug transport system fused ATPase/permease subunit
MAATLTTWRRRTPSVATLRGYGFTAWFAARAGILAEQRRDTFLGHRLAAYKVKLPPGLLRFLPPLEIDAGGQLVEGAFDERVPSDFVLSDPSVAPPPPADHPLAAEIRYAESELATRLASAARHVAEIEEERQRANADIRQLRDRLDSYREARLHCLAELARNAIASPRLWHRWSALIGSGTFYLLVLLVETAWLALPLADMAGVDVTTAASVQRSAHLLLPIVSFALVLTLGLVALVRFTRIAVANFLSAQPTRDMPAVLIAPALVLGLAALAFIAWLRATYSAAATGGVESFGIQLGFAALHMIVLVAGSRAATRLGQLADTLSAARERREALRRKWSKHEAARALITATIGEAEQRLDELRRLRTQLDTAHWEAMDGVQVYLRLLLREGETIKKERTASLHALRAALSADYQTFSLLAHRSGRTQLLGCGVAALTPRRRA